MYSMYTSGNIFYFIRDLASNLKVLGGISKQDFSETLADNLENNDEQEEDWSTV